MRLWSIHPKYLDTKGLLACWREGLLAQKVLMGGTKGYKNHPQLERFKNSDDPVGYIGSYLCSIHLEAYQRGYKFKQEKIFRPLVYAKLDVTKDQLTYEFNHLTKKVLTRDFKTYQKNFSKLLNRRGQIESHPLFKVIDGTIESWEKRK